MSRQSAGTRDLRQFIDELYALAAALRTGQGVTPSTFGKLLATMSGPLAPANVPTADGASAVMSTSTPAIVVPATATVEVQGFVVVTNTQAAIRSARVAVEASGNPGNALGTVSNSSLAASLPFSAIPFLALFTGAQVPANGLLTLNVFCTTGGAANGDLTVPVNGVVATIKRVA